MNRYSYEPLLTVFSKLSKLLEKYHFQKGNKLNEFIESSLYLFFSLLKYARSPACWGWLTTSFEILGVSWWQGNAFYHLRENSPKFSSLTSIYGCFREIQSLTAKSFENSPHYKASQALRTPISHQYVHSSTSLILPNRSSRIWA